MQRVGRAWLETWYQVEGELPRIVRFAVDQQSPTADLFVDGEEPRDDVSEQRRADASIGGVGNPSYLSGFDVASSAPSVPVHNE